MYKFFINRPIVAMVIAIITVIIGLVTLLGLPIAQFPKIIPPEIFIQANYVGADAQTIEQSVATPIEQQMRDRKSTRLNSSHVEISYAVFCLKKKRHIASHVHERLQVFLLVEAGPQ